jgi:hypothetical protein
MIDERALEVAVQQTYGSSAVARESKCREAEPAAAPRGCSASGPGLTSGPRDQLSGPSETTTWTPRTESIVRSLCARLGEAFDLAVIAAEVEAELSKYANARVTQFIPILVESRVWERLRRPDEEPVMAIRAVGPRDRTHPGGNV